MRLRANKDKRNYSKAMEMDDISPPWNLLPDIPLINVYSFLGYKDRANMSQVCKNWSKGFPAACNWQGVKFVFDETAHSDTINSAKKYLNRFGHVLKYVGIKFQCAPLNQEEVMNVALLRFQFLCICLSKQTKLVKLYFINFRPLVQRMKKTLKVTMIEAIIALLASQNRLKCIGFGYCGFNEEEFAIMLTAVRDKSSVTDIEILSGPRFHVPDNENSSHQQEDDNAVENRTHWLCGYFNTLTYWHCSYCPLLESIISKFVDHLKSRNFKNYNKLRGALRHMRIDWKFWHAGSRGISEEAWQGFSNLFPRVQVQLTIFTPRYINPKSLMTFLIRRNMPLRRLEFVITYLPLKVTASFSLLTLFEHIFQCQLQPLLEKIRVKNFSLENAEHALDRFHTFSSLKALEIIMPYPLTNLRNTLQIMSIKAPKSLQRIYVEVTNIRRSVEGGFLGKIQEQIGPMFDRRGITFVIKPNLQ